MHLTYVPLLQQERDLYRRPRDYKRFKAYLHMTIDVEAKRVRLRLYAVESAPHGGRFYRVGSDWSEDMTWRTRPTELGKLIAELGPVERGTYVEIDLTRALQADGTISLAIKTPSEEDVEYASREAGGARGPLLIVERS